MVIAISILASLGQEVSLDNYTGNWTADTSWADNSTPGTTVDGINIDIYGNITLNGNLTFDQGTITVHDTLVIHGNLNLLNNAILSIASSGIFIVDGDYYSENKVEVTTGGTLVVTGNFSMTGAEDQGSFTNDGSIFIFDDTPEIKLGDEYTDLLCPDSSDYPDNCAYGDEIDISVDPVNDFFTEVTCSQNDIVAPMLVLPAIAPVESASDIPAVYNNYNALIAAGGNATDDCSINKASFTHLSDVSDGNTCLEIITRTYSISDKAGNTVTASQSIAIGDITAPSLTLPILPNFQCTEAIPAPYSSYDELVIAGGSAIDNTGVAINSLQMVSEDTLIVGEWIVVTRVYEIADLCGNTVTVSQDILVKDFILPYLTVPKDLTLCAENAMGTIVNSIDLISCSDNCSAEADMILTYSISGSTTTSGTGNASGVFFYNGTSTVTYTITDETGNASSESFTVTVNPKPITSEINGIGSPLCEASSELYDVVLNPTSSYHWTVPSDASITTDTSGLGVNLIEVQYGFNGGFLTVTETNAIGCAGETKSLAIDLVGCPLIADFDVDISSSCINDSVTVWSTSSGISGKTTYNWDFGSDAQPSAATGPGPHTIIYSSTGNKDIQLLVEEKSIETITRTIALGGIPSDFLGPDQEICEGDSFVFIPEVAGVEYLWHNGSTEKEYLATETEIVSVSIVNDNGCSGSDTVEIVVHPAPPLDLGEDRQVCSTNGEEITVNNYATYQWSTGDITEAITAFSGDGSISLTVTDWNNCSATDEIIILPCINPLSLIEVPTILSPNGDGIQDQWTLPGIELYPDAHIVLFDLYGRKVFQETGGYTNTWNGTYNGKQLPVGRYFYIIDLKSSEIQPLTGSITIIR